VLLVTDAFNHVKHNVHLNSVKKCWFFLQQIFVNQAVRRVSANMFKTKLQKYIQKITRVLKLWTMNSHMARFPSTFQHHC